MPLNVPPTKTQNNSQNNHNFNPPNPHFCHIRLFLFPKLLKTTTQRPRTPQKQKHNPHDRTPIRTHILHRTYNQIKSNLSLLLLLLLLL